MFLGVLLAPMLVNGSEARRTPLVRAVEGARDAIVNIRGQKLVPTRTNDRNDGQRRVNGMGTGVILDHRGYIVTNFHVIDGVSTINVTLSDGTHSVATPISHDPKTDLAIIKIDPGNRSLPTIQLGTSSDLMPGETVIAVGNAYGYEHTVTRGIISALHRTVQVSDVQYYHDLIQTDASINPGNSGGPLLNIDGELVGINVAVRVGAQGIGFALPVDKVLTISAELCSVRRLENRTHGITFTSVEDRKSRQQGLLVSSIQTGSPAERAGLKPGDRIERVEASNLQWPVELEIALLGRKGGHNIPLSVIRNGETMNLELVLSANAPRLAKEENRAWSQLGLQLRPLSTTQIRDTTNSKYRGGLAVMAVRPGSPAESQGIRRGDVLVGMHVWETVSLDNVTYVLKQEKITNKGPLKFYILRGNQTLYGHLQVASAKRTTTSR
jgi:serine protease Do